MPFGRVRQDRVCRYYQSVPFQLDGVGHAAVWAGSALENMAIGMIELDKLVEPLLRVGCAFPDIEDLIG